jgi:peptide deformylase
MLRKVGEPVTEFDADLAQLADDMIDTMYDEEGIDHWPLIKSGSPSNYS